MKIVAASPEKGQVDTCQKKVESEDGGSSTEEMKRTPNLRKRTLPLRAGSRSRLTRKEKLSETSSLDSEVDYASGKRFKLDPSFTPRKFERLKDELAVTRNTIKRVYNLNLKLQEEKIVLQEKVAKLEAEVQTLMTKLKKDEGNCSSSMKTLELTKKPTVQRNLFHESITKSIKPLEEISEKPPEELPAQHNLSDAKPIIKEPDHDIKSIKLVAQVTQQDPQGLKSIKDAIKPIKPVEDIGSEEVELDPTDFCSVSLLDGERDEGKTGNGETSNTNELAPRLSISPEIMKLISSIPSGEKRDLRFIKDLVTAAFGPDVLAASTVYGTAKGGRKKDVDKSAREKKPALCPDTLKAVLEELKKRVETEEGKKADGDHPRLLKKRITGAINDAQRKWRVQGYGVGAKSNDVTVSLFQPDL